MLASSGSVERLLFTRDIAMGLVLRRTMVMMDASLMGWDAICDG